MTTGINSKHIACLEKDGQFSNMRTNTPHRTMLFNDNKCCAAHAEAMVVNTVFGSNSRFNGRKVNNPYLLHKKIFRKQHIKIKKKLHKFNIIVLRLSKNIIVNNRLISLTNNPEVYQAEFKKDYEACLFSDSSDKKIIVEKYTSNSRPCSSCSGLMRMAFINKVIYTTGNNSPIRVERISQMTGNTQSNGQRVFIRDILNK
jgi:hypothetical protein